MAGISADPGERRPDATARPAGAAEGISGLAARRRPGAQMIMTGELIMKRPPHRPVDGEATRGRHGPHGRPSVRGGSAGCGTTASRLAENAEADPGPRVGGAPGEPQRRPNLTIPPCADNAHYVR
jgi:hypothetical protein